MKLRMPLVPGPHYTACLNYNTLEDTEEQADPRPHHGVSRFLLEGASSITFHPGALKFFAEKGFRPKP